jgi:hypothetical protein
MLCLVSFNTPPQVGVYVNYNQLAKKSLKLCGA